MTVINLEQAAELLNVSLDEMKSIAINENPPKKHQTDYFLRDSLFIKEDLIEWKNERVKRKIDRVLKEADKALKETDEVLKKLKNHEEYLKHTLISLLNNLKDNNIIKDYDRPLILNLNFEEIFIMTGRQLKSFSQTK